jgi:hypothetical protein
MLERTRSRRRELPSPNSGTLDDIFSTDDSGLVTVSHGLHTEQLPVGNLTIGEIRRRYGDRFDIDPHSQGQVDGREVDDQVVVRPGQLLLFVRPAGEKGAGDVNEKAPFAAI